MWLFDLFKKKSGRKSNENEMDPSQRKFIQQMTEDAEVLITVVNKDLNGKLDYSEASLEILDREVLAFISENKEDVGPAAIEAIITQAGAYIFEVARRNYGGRYYWYHQLSQPILVTGQPVFEISILAFDKVKMRIENGDEDNIPFFFAGYAQRVKQGVKGDQALIV